MLYFEHMQSKEFLQSEFNCSGLSYADALFCHISIIQRFDSYKHLIAISSYNVGMICNFCMFYSADINECLQSDTICDHSCKNLPGGYECSCRFGFRLYGRYVSLLLYGRYVPLLLYGQYVPLLLYGLLCGKYIDLLPYFTTLLGRKSLLKFKRIERNFSEFNFCLSIAF